MAASRSDVALAEHAQARLVDQRRGLQRVALALAAKRAPGERLEFRIEQRRQVAVGGGVAIPAARQQRGDLAGVERFG